LLHCPKEWYKELFSSDSHFKFLWRGGESILPLLGLYFHLRFVQRHLGSVYGDWLKSFLDTILALQDKSHMWQCELSFWCHPASTSTCDELYCITSLAAHRHLKYKHVFVITIFWRQAAVRVSQKHGACLISAPFEFILFLLWIHKS
jgi:hypothetical protein